jgi:hypothetical protein
MLPLINRPDVPSSAWACSEEKGLIARKAGKPWPARHVSLSCVAWTAGWATRSLPSPRPVSLGALSRVVHAN